MVTLASVLNKWYYDPSHPGFYAGINKLYRLARNRFPTVSRDDIEKWLASQETYRRYRFVRRKFKRNPIIAYYIDEKWECDIADLRYLSRQNSGYKFILYAIDVLSRYAFAEPMKTKSSPEVAAALRRIFERSKRFPDNLYTDAGREFVGPAFKSLMKEYGIVHHQKKAKLKVPIAERLIGTIKSKMHHHYGNTQTKRWVDILQPVVNGYNRSYHRMLTMRPVDVKKKNEKEVFEILYHRQLTKKLPTYFKLKVGDIVNKVKLRGPITKAGTPSFTTGIYQIADIIKKPPREMYVLKDSSGRIVQPPYYREQLTLVHRSGNNDTKSEESE